MLPSGPTREPGLSPPGGCAGGPTDADTQKMSTPPTTRPETWVPAGTEREGTPGGPPAEGPASRKRAAVTMPPKESVQPTQKAKAAKTGVRTQLKRMLWAVVGAALPWAWFLVRDLGPAMQLVALALPILVAVAILGVAISAIDEKRVTSLIVIGSLGVFGWTTVMGPRSMQPTRAPQDPVRVVEVSLPTDGPGVRSVIAALQKEHADVAFLAVPSKKGRTAVASSDAFDTSVVVGGSVVLSAYPVKILPLPKGLPKGLVIRVEVDRPGRPFIAYAARATDPLRSAMDDPLDIERLRSAALDETLPVVIIGGLGVSDRSTAYRQMDLAFRDALRADTTAGNTLLGLLWAPLMLRSDYVFTSHTWCATDGVAFRVPGVDHAAVAASVGACASG